MVKIKSVERIESPKVAVDVVIFTVEDGVLKTLLIKRAAAPFRGAWALPGGFVRKQEDIYRAALRELKEETGVGGVFLEQLYTFGEPKRDPRGRVISVAYYALMSRDPLNLRASSDAAEARLFPLAKLPSLAFDHKKILAYALARVGNKIQYSNIIWSLLPRHFTLTDIQKMYETILGRRLDKRNFRKKLLSLGLIKPARKVLKGLRQRPAQLFAFKTTKLVELRRFF